MAFTTRLQSANPDVICGASADSVRTVDIAMLLKHNLRMPLFQRRYCWGVKQWSTFLSDTAKASLSRKHSLGRITCAILHRDGDGEGGTDDRKRRVLLVVDGQQRNTTAVLLLAALRDLAEEQRRLADEDGREKKVLNAIVAKVNDAIFPRRTDLEAWLQEARTRQQQYHQQHAPSGGGEAAVVVETEEGEALRFAALVPTFCDRAAFFAAILPLVPGAIAGYRAAGGATSGTRPLDAKRFFMNALRSRTPVQWQALVEAVLHKLSWLFFPIATKGSLDVADDDDGTRDLQVVFERLAQRDATWCKPSRASEYCGMGAADFVRNLLLGSFRRERRAVEVYKLLWLPIEQLATRAAAPGYCGGGAAAGLGGLDGGGGGSVANALEAMLDAFLSAEKGGADATTSGDSCSVLFDLTAGLGTKQSTLAPHLLANHYVGGLLYSRFRAWFSSELSKGSGAVVSGAAQPPAMPPPPPQPRQTTSPAAEEQITTELLQRLHAFATRHFSDPMARPLAPETNARARTQAPQGTTTRNITSEVALRDAGQPGVASAWKCPRCSTDNPPGAHMCTACCLAR